MTNADKLAHQLCARIAKNAGASTYTAKDHSAMIEWLTSPHAAGEKDPALVEKNYAEFVKVMKRTQPTSVDQFTKALLAGDGLNR
jgi:hypothetical protein